MRSLIVSTGIISAGLLILAADLPATAQDTSELPIFKQAPISGTLSGSRGCVSAPYKRQGGVLKQADPGGVPPPYVPVYERATGFAAMTVPRTAERTYIRFLITTSGDALPDVARSLGAQRELLESVLREARLQVLSLDLVGAAITGAGHRIQRDSGRSVTSNLRVGALLVGEIDEQAIASLVAQLRSVRIERIDFDFPSEDAIAEDLRPILERDARADAAAFAAYRGAKLAGLLSSELVSKPAIEREPGHLTVTAKLTFSMADAAAKHSD